MDAFIEFRHVTKAYGAGKDLFLAADNISFSLREGELVVLLGPSGAGKSTILNLLGGMDRVTEGEIVVKDSNIALCNDRKLAEYRARHVGFVFQFYNLLPALTALENVALAKDITQDALDPMEMLAMVGLSDKAAQFPSQLSGGEQQRVSIARALCKNPTVLLCDEPTGALDSVTGTVILSLLQDMCRVRGKTVIIVTHNSALAQAADRIIRVKNGRITDIAENPMPLPVSEVSW